MSMPESVLKQVVESLPFVRNHKIELDSVGAGKCKAYMPKLPEFSTPPNNFPAAMVGMIGDVAAISACISELEAGFVCSTMDFTIKMTDIADGERLEAEAEALNVGKTIATGESKIYSVSGNDRKLCAIVVVTGRVVPVK